MQSRAGFVTFFSGNSAASGSFLFSPVRSCSLLAAPPSLVRRFCGRSIRVLLERNPPKASPRPGRRLRLWGERAIPLLIKKGIICLTNTLNPPHRTRTPLPPLTCRVKTFRLGRIKAAVWENESEQQKFYSVTFARTYVGDDNKYHDTDSFGRDDLPLVAKLADQAHTFIFERLAEMKTKQSE
jgi:hypothetical protein